MHLHGVDLSQSPWTTYYVQGGCEMFGGACVPPAPPNSNAYGRRSWSLPVTTDPDSPASSELYFPLRNQQVLGLVPHGAYIESMEL